MAKAVPQAITAQNSWLACMSTAHHTQRSFFVAPSLEAMIQLPHLFLSITAAQGSTITSLSVREKSLRDIKELLESSFLGQSYVYGIWDLEQCSKNVLAPLVEYLVHYAGPHHLIVCCSAEFSLLEDFKKQALVLPAQLTASDMLSLCDALQSQEAHIQSAKLLAHKNGQIPLTNLLVAFPYLSVLGRSLVPSFKQVYLPRLIKSDVGSLFSFTDLLWQKNSAAFYAEWARIKELYMPQFWLTFWSDQFFRAYCYAHAMRHKHSAVAQTIAARKLSFFYTKTAWQRIDSELLVTLHDMIYRIDHTSKTGGTTDMLEYIYQRWFTYD